MRGLFLGLAFMLAAAGLAGAQNAPSAAAKPGQAVAVFAGGCFWCTESDFDKVPGVLSTVSGYIGGKTANPTYQSISSGTTGHAEAVQVTYDTSKVPYEALVKFFWRTIDPTVKDAQFCDKGSQYRSAIFVRNDAERRVAEASKKEVAAQLNKPIYTEIANASTFTAAEDYHQDFYTKNPAKYKFYRWNCGRDQRLEQIWGAKKEGS